MDKLNSFGLFNIIKQIIDGYLTSRGLTRIVIGVYRQGLIDTNDNLKLPLSLITGALKQRLKEGDKLRLLRDEGCKEYYILEIINRPLAFDGELKKLDDDVKRLEKRIK